MQYTKRTLIQGLMLAFLGVVFTASAQAASSKRIQQSIDASDFSHIDFEISVAEVEIEVYDGDTVEIDIELRAERSWWIFGRGDVDDVDLTVRQDRDGLELILDEDDIEQDWRVRLPAHMAVGFELGVGEIGIEGFNNNLALELGVGAVRVVVTGEDYDQIRVSTGVGDSSIRGFNNGSDNERSFVGADSCYRGDGSYEIEIEVGVGDASVVRR